MKYARDIIFLAALWLAAVLCHRGCNSNPWPTELSPASDTIFQSYSAQIKTLDPTSANYAHELAILCNVVDSPLAYHYLKRPYELIPQLLEEIPSATYFDREGNTLDDNAPADKIARCEYILHIRKDIHFQPHPCFAPQEKIRAMRSNPRRPEDFAPQATRELHAMDFKTALVRMCDPRVSSTVFSTFSTFIAGMRECSDAIHAAVKEIDHKRLEDGETQSMLADYPSVPDYGAIPLAGCQIVDDHTLKIILTRKYPQFIYWLAMCYTAPIPQEALDFYSRKDVRQSGMTFATWPVGTGAYMLEECDTNSRIVLARNPQYHTLSYPADGASEEDIADGLLEDAGKPLPLNDKVVFNFERESIPNWLKFRQGYYDTSGIPNDMFDSAIDIAPGSGELKLSDEMAARGIKMSTTVPPITYYFAFNMLDPLLGGLDSRKCALRQALSIAIDTDEYVAIFKNGNGIPSDSILPPGIFGASEPPLRMNRVLFTWDDAKGAPVRRGIQDAKELMTKAGYAGGIDPSTGRPLQICLDHADAGKPDFKNRFQWLAERFAQLGVELLERPSDLNRNREKINAGNWQMLFERGWVADYPDPENFLQLFYSANGRVVSKGKGANYSNYASEEFDAVFTRMETMSNNAQRLELIDQACNIINRDAPYCWDYSPVNTTLTNPWLHNSKPSGIANDTIKYLKVDARRRAMTQREWNQPDWKAIFTLPTLVTLLIAIRRFRGKNRLLG